MNFYALHQQRSSTARPLYGKIAQVTKSAADRETLAAISRDEYKHAQLLAKFLGRSLTPDRFYVGFHALLNRLLGYTFVIKRLERGEDRDIAAYGAQIEKVPSSGHFGGRAGARGKAAGDPGTGEAALRGGHGSWHERRAG
jgi:hypothetical protein